MAVFSLSFIVVVLFVLVDLVFIVKPVKGFGLLNLVLGMFSILFSLYFGFSSEAIGDLSIAMKWFFALFVALVGILCLWRGLSGGLSE